MADETPALRTGAPGTGPSDSTDSSFDEFHDDDELAAALAGQLAAVTRTGPLRVPDDLGESADGPVGAASRPGVPEVDGFVFADIEPPIRSRSTRIEPGAGRVRAGARPPSRTVAAEAPTSAPATAERRASAPQSAGVDVALDEEAAPAATDGSRAAPYEPTDSAVATAGPAKAPSADESADSLPAPFPAAFRGRPLDAEPVPTTTGAHRADPSLRRPRGAEREAGLTGPNPTVAARRAAARAASAPRPDSAETGVSPVSTTPAADTAALAASRASTVDGDVDAPDAVVAVPPTKAEPEAPPVRESLADQAPVHAQSDPIERAEVSDAIRTIVRRPIADPPAPVPARTAAITIRGPESSDVAAAVPAPAGPKSSEIESDPGREWERSFRSVGRPDEIPTRRSQRSRAADAPLADGDDGAAYGPSADLPVGWAVVETGPLPMPSWSLSAEIPADAVVTAPPSTVATASAATVREVGAPSAGNPITEPTAASDLVSGTEEPAADPLLEAFAPLLVDDPAPSTARMPRIAEPPALEPGAKTALLSLLIADRPPIVPAPIRPRRGDAEWNAARSAVGFLASFGIWAGALASPVAIVLGFALGGSGILGSIGLLLGAALALPAVARVTTLGARAGAGQVEGARLVFGVVGGAVVGVLLLLGRIAAAVLGLLALAQIATAFSARTGVPTGLPTDVTAIVVVLAAGVAATVCVVWRERVSALVLLGLGALGMLVTVLLLVVLPATAGGAPSRNGSPFAAATIGFVIGGIVVAGSAADVARSGLRPGAARGSIGGTVVGALVGLLVVAAGMTVGTTTTGDPATAFVDLLVDATPAATAPVLAVVLVVGTLSLIALLIRSAGLAVADLLGASSPALGVVASGLAVLAIALGVLAAGGDPASLLTLVGPIIAVPLAAWAGVTTFASLGPAGGRRIAVVPFSGLVVASVAGLLLLDGVILPGERSGLLGLTAVRADSPWRTSSALALGVALVIGLVTGLLARVGGGAAPERSPSSAE